ncbi:MAG: SufD family Fe-S cluster assembly protein, partial [Lachnospiraceae bacterium]|nr:SufD family Fe-S cluster assembly protein [Lachnospiraceae bacterium]
MLLLDDTIVNKTVPLILCTEETVAGSHGATIGKPAEDILFYMTSRGIPRERAVAILERASLEAAANRIEDEEAKQQVLEIIAGKYADE